MRSVVLSESMAKNYGKPIQTGDEVVFFDRNFGEMPLEVVGIMKDWPTNSHIEANGIVSLSTLGLHNSYSPWASLDNWGWNDYYTYVRMDGRPNDEALFEIIDNNLGEDFRKQFQISLDFQPVSDIHTYSQLTNELNDNNNQQTLKLSHLHGCVHPDHCVGELHQSYLGTRTTTCKGGRCSEEPWSDEKPGTWAV